MRRVATLPVMAIGLRLEVAHAVLYVHNVEDMIEFYTNTLGFEVTDRGPLGRNEIVFLSQGDDHHQVAFITGRDDTGSVQQRAPRCVPLVRNARRSEGVEEDTRGRRQGHADHAALPWQRLVGVLP